MEQKPSISLQRTEMRGFLAYIKLVVQQGQQLASSALYLSRISLSEQTNPNILIHPQYSSTNLDTSENLCGSEMPIRHSISARKGGHIEHAAQAPVQAPSYSLSRCEAQESMS